MFVFVEKFGARLSFLFKLYWFLIYKNLTRKIKIMKGKSKEVISSTQNDFMSPNLVKMYKIELIIKFLGFTNCCFGAFRESSIGDTNKKIFPRK